VLLSQANFLLLDEPTNHLDMQSVNILIQALDQYEGTYVVVSHDRFFVSQIANKIWYIEDEQIKEYPGTYDEYEWWMSERQANGDTKPAPAKPAPQPVAVAPSANSVPRNGSDLQRKEWQNALKKANQQAEEMEAKISSLEAQKKKLEAELADPTTYGTNGALQTRQTDYQRLTRDLDALQQQWETAMTDAEELQEKLKV
jgi:ATP-binding cassette subfamily F protein 3